MGGHPLWRLALTIGGLLLLLPLVFQLTKTVNLVPASVAQATPATASDLALEITFAQPVQRFSVDYSGRNVWASEAASGTVQRALPIPFPSEGIDLKIHAEWADAGADTAARITVTPAGQAPIVQTAWARGKLDEVLTFVEAAP